jgi:hypothetical protein
MRLEFFCGQERAMTTRKDLPEEATEEPRIRSPEEDAERAARRQEAGDSIVTAKEARHLGDPDNPLRIPGELSSRPQEDPTDHRPGANEPEASDEDEDGQKRT